MASDFRLGISEEELEQIVELLWRATWAIKPSKDFSQEMISRAVHFHDRFAAILKKQEADRIVAQWFSSVAEEREYNRVQRELNEELGLP